MLISNNIFSGNMDLKKEAASAAFGLARNHSSIGLGAGRTIGHLAEFLRDAIWHGLDIELYTSSFQTRELLQGLGIEANDISKTARLDQYFDGCDLVDEKLNVLKSGAGIHSSEKLYAAMADEFIILAEETKFVSVMDPKVPLVLEVLPDAVYSTINEILEIFPATKTAVRDISTDEKLWNAVHGNHLVDVWFEQWPELFLVQQECKNITGIIEISLFYQMAHQAIIAGNNGVRMYVRNKGREFI